jgi:hypothetical protein
MLYVFHCTAFICKEWSYDVVARVDSKESNWVINPVKVTKELFLFFPDQYRH